MKHHSKEAVLQTARHIHEDSVVFYIVNCKTQQDIIAKIVFITIIS